MRTKNVINIIMSSAVLQIVVAISGIILPRLIIQYYGSEMNGLISSIKQIISYFSIVSLGLGGASSVALYKPLSKKDNKQISAILSATRIFYNKTGYYFAILLSLLTILYPLIINTEQGYLNTIAIIIILGVGGICEYIIVSKYRILLMADQKNNIVSNITTQGVILNTIVSIILIYLKASIIWIQIISTLVYIIRLLWTKKYVQKLYPEIDYYAEPNFSAISNRWNAFIYQLPNMIISYTPITLITFFMGLKSASIYAVYNMIYSSISMIVGIFSSGINASFGNLLVKGENEILQRSYDTYLYIFRIINFGFYTAAFILTIPFIKIYIVSSDGVNYIIPILAVGFALNGLLRDMRKPSVMLVESAGKFKENSIYNIIESIINIILSIILIKVFGISGILIASAFTAFIRSIMYIAYTEENILNRSCKRELVIIFINIIASICISIYAIQRIKFILIDNFITWLIVAVIISAVVFTLLIIVNSIISFKCVKDIFIRLKRIRKSYFN